MTSLRHNPASEGQDSPRDGYLDAARACILDVGWRRTTLTEVARRAGVSRMTIYRTWPDMPQLLGDLMTREWSGVVATAVAGQDPDRGRRRPAGRRHRRHGPRAARQRAVRPDHRARPRADPPLPAVPPRPLAGPDPRAHRGGHRRGPDLGRGPEGRPHRDGPRAGAHRSRFRDLGAHDGRRPCLGGRARRRAGHRPRPDARAMTATRITPGLDGAPTDVDVVVIGLGVTGAGVALDAVTRGLSVLAVDAHDLAFGTSRWSSKLVHGGLRYLAYGPGRHRPRERRRARHPDGGHRAAPHPRDADPAAAQLLGQPSAAPRSPGPGCTPATSCAGRPAPTRETLPRRGACPPPR